MKFYAAVDFVFMEMSFLRRLIWYSFRETRDDILWMIVAQQDKEFGIVMTGRSNYLFLISNFSFVDEAEQKGVNFPLAWNNICKLKFYQSRQSF